MLVQDICSMLVPPQVAREASTATLLRHAVRQVPAEETSTLDDVVALPAGHRTTTTAGNWRNLLLDTAEMPLAHALLRPPAAPALLGADAALTVITMAGLRLPDLKIEREYWSAEEALALPMLHTAHRLAVRRCYGGSMASRKLVGLDEAHFMEGWRSGPLVPGPAGPRLPQVEPRRAGRLAEPARHPRPRRAEPGLDRLRRPHRRGRRDRLRGAAAAAGAGRRRVRGDAGLAVRRWTAASSSRLGFREFVMRDVDGRVQKVRVDVSYVEGLLDYLDTTPAAAAGRRPRHLPQRLSDLEDVTMTPRRVRAPHRS